MVSSEREQVLIVCTGNICRSPMAMALLQSLLVETAPHVVVRSAGLLTDGIPATSEAIAVMGQGGLDLAGHRSSLMRSRLADAPDLIVGMAREHLRAVVAEDERLFPRTFTLKELVDRAESSGPRTAQESMQDYLDRIGRGRGPADLMRLGRRYDIEDPIGQGIGAYRACASEIEGLVTRLVASLWPPPTSTTPRDASRR